MKRPIARAIHLMSRIWIRDGGSAVCRTHWSTWVTPTPDPTPPALQKPLIDATTASPEELAAHLREAIAWTQANRDINPANVILIYAWNEHDEGGWLQPTLGADGKPDHSRLDALKKVLRP